MIFIIGLFGLTFLAFLALWRWPMHINRISAVYRILGCVITALSILAQYRLGMGVDRSSWAALGFWAAAAAIDIRRLKS